MKKIKLDSIRIDGGTQSRVVIDQPTVYNYLEHMKEGDEFPRMFAVYDGTTFWLVDGFHRYHALKLLGIKEVEIDYKPGTLQEAQVLSFGANGTHGKQRTNEDKRKAVESALEHPMTCNKTDAEIARICKVSKPFVAAVRNPDVKKKQKANVEKHYKEKAEKEAASNSITPSAEAPASNSITPNPNDGDAPSREEIEAAEEALKADQDMMYKMLESDDALKVAVEENKRLNLRVSQLEARLRGLMNEKNAAVKMVKDLQKQLDKAKAKK